MSKCWKSTASTVSCYQSEEIKTLKEIYNNQTRSIQDSSQMTIRVPIVIKENKVLIQKIAINLRNINTCSLFGTGKILAQL
jgi:hypothetical protein